MLNDIIVYIEVGIKAGKAQNVGDASLVRFHQDWVRRAIALEKDGDKQIAQHAYASSYAAARNVPRVR